MTPQRILLLRDSGPPHITFDSFEHETYFLLVLGLLKKNIFNEGILLYLNSQTEKVETTQINPQIKFVQSPTNDIFKEEYFDFVFIRGEFREYPEFLKNISWGKLGFYSATAKLFPRLIDPRLINYLYLNEKEQITLAKKLYPWMQFRIFDKPVDENIFYPKPTKKFFDLCILANFRPRKHFTMLYEAIAKLPCAKDLKIVVVGDLFKSGYEARMLAGEYELNVTYTNLIPLTQVADYLRQSKFMVLASKLEANPRALYESLACNIPILVNAEMTGGLHLINRKTGHREKLWKFEQAVDYMLKNYQRFAPFEYFKKEMSLEKIIARLAVDFQ